MQQAFQQKQFLKIHYPYGPWLSYKKFPLKENSLHFWSDFRELQPPPLFNDYETYMKSA